jgi:ATP-dependent Clp endopeptidase proteolytic subunit ClpP
MEGARSLVSRGEIYIYGVIDPFSWGDGDTVRSIDVVQSLAELADSESLVIHINSPGGSLYEGLAIYDLIRGSGKPVSVKVEGLAASVATIIAMSGSEISMAEGATMMIHDPWTVTVGNASDHGKSAGELERLGVRMSEIYAARTGRTAEEIRAAMLSETWFSASEAVEFGLADSVDEPMKIAACAPLPSDKLVGLFTHKISAKAERNAAPAAQPKERQMAVNDKANGGPTPTAEIVKPVEAAIVEERTQIAAEAAATLEFKPLAVGEAFDVRAAAKEAVAAERKRATEIRAAVRAVGLPEATADKFIEDGTSADAARIEILNLYAAARGQEEGSMNPTKPAAIEVVADSFDKFYAAAETGLMARLGYGGERNEFSGLQLAELARACLDQRGVKAQRTDRMSMIGAAFTVRASGPGYHSTSDFGNILGSVAYKAMMKGYEEVDETFPMWTGKGTASDFRPISRVDMGLFPSLPQVNEGGEYTYATIGDSGTVVQVATYGRMFSITRQAIVNDDLQFFDRVPRRMGRAAKRTIGDLVYAILNNNPTMQDATALFHSSHGNLAASGSVISVASIGAADAAMAIQKDDGGIGTGGGVRGKYLLVPHTLKMAANTVLSSANIPGDAGQVANPVRGLLEVIPDSRLSGTAWYVASDPVQTDTIEVTYLDGVEEPFLDQKDGWGVDGTEFKVRMDAGVKALHWRGLYRNPGA